MKEPERILIFEPHPDDVCFQISGSVKKWVLQGKDVTICTVTTGNNSTFNPDVSQEEIKKIMMKEHAKALELMGIDDAHYVQWEYDDLGLDAGRDRLELLERMIELIRRVRPVTVVTMDPRNALNEENPDHRAVASVGFEAACLSPHPHLFPEQYEKEGVRQHYVSRILFYMSPEPDTFIDIAGAPFDTKEKVGLAYESQLELLITEARERLAGLDIDLPLFNMPHEAIWQIMCRSIAKETAEECRSLNPERTDIELAEAFRLQYPGVVHKIKGILPGILDFKDEKI